MGDVGGCARAVATGEGSTRSRLDDTRGTGAAGEFSESIYNVCLSSQAVSSGGDNEGEAGDIGGANPAVRDRSIHSECDTCPVLSCTDQSIVTRVLFFVKVTVRLMFCH